MGNKEIDNLMGAIHATAWAMEANRTYNTNMEQKAIQFQKKQEICDSAMLKHQLSRKKAVCWWISDRKEL